MSKYFGEIGLSTLWTKIKNTFVSKESGKGLSSNDFTNTYKTKVDNIDSTVSSYIGAHNTNTGAHNDIRNSISNLTDRLNELDDNHTHDEYLLKSGGTITGNLGVGGNVVQGNPSADSSIASMNRFERDLFVEGNGSAPNNPQVAGFYMGKSATDGNRHLDIVSGETYSYIDFNKGDRKSDYDVRLLVNVVDGDTQFMWGQDGALTQKKFNVVGGILMQNGVAVALQNQIPTKTSQLTNDSGFKTTDNNTTYSLSKSGNTITLTGSDGSTTSVTDSNGNVSYDVATSTANGLMSASDKSKLDGIVEGADAVSVSRNLTSGTKIGTITVNGTAYDLYAPTNTDTTYGVATTSANGLMSASDKTKLDSLSATPKESKTVFNSDGSIKVTYTDGTSETIVFKSDGSIVTTHSSGKVTTVKFNSDGSISTTYS